MDPKAQSWLKHWGTSYDSPFKEISIIKVLKKLSEDGGLGRDILDVGCGYWPVTCLLNHSRHRVVGIDIVAEEYETETECILQYDIEELDRVTPRTIRTFWRIARFLGPNALIEGPQVFDTIVLSEILNYVDGPTVLKSLHRFIKPGGKLIILNGLRGDKELFSPQVPTHENEIFIALCKARFTPSWTHTFDDEKILGPSAKLRMTVIVANRVESEAEVMAWADQILNKTPAYS